MSRRPSTSQLILDVSSTSPSRLNYAETANKQNHLKHETNCLIKNTQLYYIKRTDTRRYSVDWNQFDLNQLDPLYHLPPYSPILCRFKITDFLCKHNATILVLMILFGKGCLTGCGLRWYSNVSIRLKQVIQYSCSNIVVPI